MEIRRLRVEEGFFDQLDLKFTPGLNVMIGGRGVGKTSVIELIRYGLGIRGLTEESHREATRHARAVLQSGQVIVDLEIDGETISFSRTGKDDDPDKTLPWPEPIIFSQTEIEGIALDANGRLKLIDSFLDDGIVDSPETQRLKSNINSHCVAILEFRRQIDELTTHVSTLDSKRAEKDELVLTQRKFSEANSAIGEEQGKLELLQTKTNSLVTDLSALEEYQLAIEDWGQSLAASDREFIAPTVTNSALQKSLLAVSQRVSVDQKDINRISTNAVEYLEALCSVQEVLGAARAEYDSRARELRVKIEGHQEGAGLVAQKLGEISEVIARLERMLKNRSDKEAGLKEKFRACEKDLEELTLNRMKIFEQRKKVVSRLNESLGPTISLEIEHLGQLKHYQAAIVEVLQGSGLRYNEIAPIISNRISPQELLKIVADGDEQVLADILEIPTTRASRLLGYLMENDIGPILTAEIKDSTEFTLLDGVSYKKVSDLSIGQRCTVALSIALENDSRVLIVDQPEDHLDNEFIADTLIKAIRQRALTKQSIVSSHNANIPVLGSASNVVQFDSNGRRGFRACQGPLMSTPVINAIESILEGGKEAFKTRANVYGTKELKDQN